MNIGKKYEVLNSKRVKEIEKILRGQWGFKEKIGHGFLQKENDIFLITTSVDKIDAKQFNINSLGLYFAEIRNSQLRLSIEGSQIIGKKAAKNVVELDDEQMRQWIRGEDVELITATAASNGKNDLKNSSSNSGGNYSYNGYVIVGHNGDFFGCGRIKEGKLLNFVPKARRLLSG